jgi:hypothetical protein
LVRVPTQQQVLAAAGDKLDYARAGRQFGIPPGLAYLVATGRPADGNDAIPAEPPGPGVIQGSTQHLVYGSIAVVNPTEQPAVMPWIQQRARSDLPA